MLLHPPGRPPGTAPFTRADLPRLGLSRRRLERLLADGSVVQPLRGVYLATASSADPVARAQAVGLVLPAGAAVGRRAAAWLYGTDPRAPDELGEPLTLECVVPAGSVVPRRRGLVPHEARLPPGDVVDLDGVRVTSAERTALDLARHLRPHMALAVLDALAGAGRVDPAALLERLEEWRGERHVARARRLIQHCEPSTESYGESWLRLRVLDAGFPRPVPQIWIVDDDGRRLYRLDLGWPDRRLAIEYDGVEFHEHAAARAADQRRRDDLARRFGWTVVGVGRGEVLGRRLDLEEGVGQLLGMAPRISQRLW